MKEINHIEVQTLALKEFNEYLILLKENKVDYQIIKQKRADAPDSIFLNNWFSTHKNDNIPEGLLIIYPVKAENRRIERDQEIIDMLKKDYAHFVDLTFLEKENQFLESTGSLIFDHNNKKIYCCYSERATSKAVEIFLETINKFSKFPYNLIAFNAFDLRGKNIYHTNCMMAMLEHHAVVCLSSITDEKERAKVKRSLEENRKIIDLSQKQVENFCGNIINVKNSEGNTVLIMSSKARKAFTKRQIKTFSKSYSIMAAKIPTIESVGGGSTRCMVAEIF
jgi:hypothetical protein